MRNFCFGILFFTFSLLWGQSNKDLAAVKESIRVGDFDNALRKVETLTQQTPKSKDVWLWKAILLARMNQNEKAESTLKEGFELCDKNMAIYWDFGNWCLLQERNTLAEVCFNKILSLDPQSAEAMIGNANLLNLKKEYGKSVSLLAKVNETSIKDSTLRDKFPFLYAEALYGTGKTSDAWDKMESFLARHIAPYHFGARVMATDWFISEAKYEKALNLLNEMLSYLPSEEQIKYMLVKRAECYHLLKKDILACGDLAEAEAKGMDTSLLVLRNKLACEASNQIHLSSGKNLIYSIKMNREENPKELVFNLEDYAAGKVLAYSWKYAESHKGHTSVSGNEVNLHAENVRYLELEQDEISGESLLCWLGTSTFESLKNGKMLIPTSMGSSGFETKGIQKLLVKEKGKDKLVTCVYVKSEDFGEIWVLDNAENPLIIKLQRGDYSARLMNVE